MNIMSSRRKTVIRFLEFFIVGLGLGLAEDLLAIKFTTDAAITRETVGLVFLIALPFAIFSELIVDHPDFWRKLLGKNNEEKQTR
jgi:hypothetical protein